jgi:hypothetical protein
MKMFFRFVLFEKICVYNNLFTVHVQTMAGGRVRLWAINLN